MKIINGVAKEIRHYIGAIAIFIFVIGILIFLAFNEILQKRNEGLSAKVENLIMQKDDLEKMLITIQTNIIDQLTLLGANAFDTIYSKKKECSCGENDYKCKGK